MHDRKLTYPEYVERGKAQGFDMEEGIRPNRSVLDVEDGPPGTFLYALRQDMEARINSGSGISEKREPVRDIRDERTPEEMQEEVKRALAEIRKGGNGHVAK